MKETKDITSNCDQKNSKKKIFLSMKDIQDVQYKKYIYISYLDIKS